MSESKHFCTMAWLKTGDRAMFLVAWLVASTIFWLVRLVELPLLRGPNGMWAMAEADAYARMYLVRNVTENGESVRQRVVEADNAPFGRINEWTSPVTLLGVLSTRMVRLLTGLPLEASLRMGMLILGPVVGWAALWLLGWLGYRWAGWPLAFCWMLPFSLSPDILTITRFGNADHHSLHFLLFATSTAWLLVTEERAGSLAGMVLGTLCGLALWSAGSELLPLILLIGALAFWESVGASVSGGLSAFWRGWYGTGFVVSLLTLLFEFYPQPIQGQLEMISPAHVLLWAVIAWLVEQAGQKLPWWKLVIQGALSLGIMIVAVGLLKDWQWSRLHVFQDPFFQREAGITREFEPWARTLPEWFRAVWTQTGGLPLLALIGSFALFRRSLRGRWVVMTLLFYVFLACMQMRWLDFAVPLLILIAGIGAGALFRRRPMWAPILMLLAVMPLVKAPWQLYRQVAAASPEARLGPFHEAFALEAAADCLATSGQPPIVLAPWFHGSVLFGSGKVRTVASPYWSNRAGLRDGALMFATRSLQEFVLGLRKHHITHILIPDRERTARAISQSWILAYGYPPTWEELQQTIIWRIASRRETPFVPCEGMRRIRPDWRVISVSDLQKAGYLSTLPRE